MAKDKTTEADARATQDQGVAGQGVAGEERAPVTTLALGEEHTITTLVGEQVQLGPELSKAAGDQAQATAVTTMVGETWYPPLPVTTLALGEENPTTFMLGEEETQITTKALGEEGPITTIVGEQSSISFTTTIVGEEGPVVTTLVGEQHQVPSATTVVGEDVGGGGGGGGTGGAFGNY